MIEVFVGTSGWLYDWNVGMSLDWYVSYSGLNAIELNSSFYRTPFKNQILSWGRRGRSLRWVIKVHRYITHISRLSNKALNFWVRFYEVFKPMEDLIDLYLLQLPPTYTYSYERLGRIKDFIKYSQIPNKLAIEFRHESWFTRSVELCEELNGVTLVSVDSPQGTWLVQCSKTVYLRLHGRAEWYNYDYSDSELMELAMRILNLRPHKVYVFFNNNHWMLENARKMLKLLKNLKPTP